MSLCYEWNSAAPAKSRDDHEDKSTREKWERKSAINLGLALIVIPLISLALWCHSCRLSGQSFWCCRNELQGIDNKSRLPLPQSNPIAVTVKGF